ncbi:ABC transporter substrate-binding protein [Actinospica durhamensis]|uniref:ABC transporter substrate-binding protein n=1 Tax=Actinospica durhamensis TaxID=1508375 RepID=A0A941EJ72_9ACTN|nr:ABC transporter substrate-binding protein [Actinospica durhamensis]MBR7831803.1 ABC transporter substrate-binding protein [Actinospica durhamensis]
MSTPDTVAPEPSRKTKQPPNLSRRSLVALALGAGVTAAAVPWTSGTSSRASAAAASLTPVTLALDWTPNTNHTGIFVAQQLGYFRELGIDLKILPYGSTAPETLISSYKTDFGISYQDGTTEAYAAGSDIVSVYAILQKTDVAIGVSAKSGITSPAQLDGKTYAGYGSPLEVPMLQYVIKAAGGTGQFKDVTLNTSAYQAVYSGQADFAMPEPTWEVLQAQQVGEPLRVFSFGDYGFPNIYSAIISSSQRFLKANGPLAKRFLEAVTRGYVYAVQRPVDAANLLIQANESALGGSRALVLQSAQLEAAQYYLNADNQVGVQTYQNWKALTDFMYTNAILTDSAGQPLKTAPSISGLYTNAYLPAAVSVS